MTLLVLIEKKDKITIVHLLTPVVVGLLRRRVDSGRWEIGVCEIATIIKRLYGLVGGWGGVYSRRGGDAPPNLHPSKLDFDDSDQSFCFNRKDVRVRLHR